MQTNDVGLGSADVDVAALVSAARAGDQAAWNTLVDRYNRFVWSVARSFRLSSADAADAVQMTWLRLVENLDRITEPERIVSWLGTTVRRECLQHLRRSGRDRTDAGTDFLVNVSDQAPPLETALLEEERDRALWHAMGMLSEKCQQLLRVLMASPPPAYVDVATTLSMPIGSIGPARKRCLVQLRRIVEAGDMFGDLPSPAGGVMTYGPGHDPSSGDRGDGFSDSDPVLGVGETDVDDEELDSLMERLRFIGAQVDPVPSIVADLAHAALETRDLDAELASLTADSAVDPAALVRSVGVAMPRMLSFEAESVTLELQIERRDDTATIRGFVLGAADLAVETRDGVIPVPLDEQGWFLAENVAVGAVRFRIGRPDAGRVTTEWMAL